MSVKARIAHALSFIGLSRQAMASASATKAVPANLAGGSAEACARLFAYGPVVVCALAISIAQEAWAQAKERSGKDVFESSCARCHGTGAQGAPKIGDKEAWSKLSQQGLTNLTQIALKGIRQMPPHGGNPALTDLEIRRAITYMVNQSGGKWVEPIGRTAKPRAERSGEQIVKAQCVKCHRTGAGGAPKIGDREAWIPRIKQGLDVVVRSAINGHGGMPARGGMADTTDSEIRSAVVYMFNKGTVPAK